MKWLDNTALVIVIIGAVNWLVLYEQDKQGRPYISIVMGASQKSILYDNMTRLMSSGINGK